tara:strand:- start:733 stop:834 length:102 start_codon:yes stop_codon:yes gene_type:complete
MLIFVEAHLHELTDGFMELRREKKEKPQIGALF